jgi:carbon-monoxide dehydrogenase large subunit
VTEQALDLGRFVGRSVRRAEDPRLLTGRGRYTDDVDLPGMLELMFVRSPLPHARIKAIDASSALASPGVERVLTIEDLDRLGLGDLPITSIAPGQRMKSFPLLARGRVRFVGEPVAVVAAESRYLAEDAAELVEVDYEPLEVVTDPIEALEPGAPLIHEEWGDNVIARMVQESGDVDRAIAEADVVVRERLKSHRYTSMPLETRAALAHLEPHGVLTVRISSQAPHRARTHLAELLGWPEHRLRVLTPDVGGGFGLKEHAYAEEALTAALAVETRRPVKWVEDRREHFLASLHAREQLHEVELAARSDGTIVALRDRVVADQGARPERIGVGPLGATLAALPGPYRIEHYRAEGIAVATNKVPSGGYRGFGQTQAVFALERAVDRLARALELDPAELRRRNFIGPEEFPFTSAAGMTYDSGDYATALDQALELAEYEHWRERRAEARAEGRFLGIGICSYVEATGLAPSKMMAQMGMRMGGYEHVTVEMDPQGRVTVATGMMSTGQGHETTLAQLCADALGIGLDDVIVLQGDTSMTPYAPAGSIGSRGAAVGGAAVLLASGRLKERLRQIGAHMLEAHHDDVEVAEGRAFIRGAPDRVTPIAKIAEAAHLAHDLPDGHAPGLVEQEAYDPPGITFAYATHVAVVEIDPDTGGLAFHRYAIVHDCGTAINPMVVDGQVIGGVAQGIGGAVLEELVYTEDGQPATTSFMDYLLPTAAEIPEVELGRTVTPSPIVPGGMKGAGEGGAIAPPAVVANAVEDALLPLGVEITETPLSPSRIWELMDAARTAGAKGSGRS